MLSRGTFSFLAGTTFCGGSVPAQGAAVARAQKQGDLMIRKLFAVLLVTGLGLAASAPAPAIDFICSCSVCANGQGPACRDFHSGTSRFTSCSTYWAKYCQ